MRRSIPLLFLVLLAAGVLITRLQAPDTVTDGPFNFTESPNSPEAKSACEALDGTWTGTWKSDGNPGLVQAYYVPGVGCVANNGIDSSGWHYVPHYKATLQQTAQQPAPADSNTGWVLRSVALSLAVAAVLRALVWLALHR